jgi:NAD(P)-dependent dehydrogenase (short-subunit alcohol dehydrogenase family)
MGLLEGKVALVTGGGSGIGRATARAFAREGAKVVVTDVAVEGGQETVRSIEESQAEAIFIKADVSQTQEVKALIDQTLEAYGAIDCALNNAGIQGMTGATAACTEKNWDRVIDINLKGVWLCMKYQIPQMRQQGSGSIVNMASVAGVSSLRRLPAYAASKHGVVGLTKTTAVEYAKAGIRVNAVCPGFIQTPMVESNTDGAGDLDAWLDTLVPLGRLGTPEEVAETVVWLCSDRASYVTGHALVVDGGFLVQ